MQEVDPTFCKIFVHFLYHTVPCVHMLENKLKTCLKLPLVVNLYVKLSSHSIDNSCGTWAFKSSKLILDIPNSFKYFYFNFRLPLNDTIGVLSFLILNFSS